MTANADYVEGIRAALKTQYLAVPDCMDVFDEPAGDFGIAHTGGVLSDGCVFMSYDVGVTPHYHTVVHEIGHAINAMLFNKQFGGNVGAWEDATCVQDFWAACGFPVTIAEADAESTDFQNKGWQFASWQRIPAEVFAETFAWMVCQDYRQTYDWGVPPNQTEMLAFFTSLGRSGGTTMPTQAEYDAHVADEKNTDEAIKKVLSELSNRMNDLDLFLKQIVKKYPL